MYVYIHLLFKCVCACVCRADITLDGKNTNLGVEKEMDLKKGQAGALNVPSNI